MRSQKSRGPVGFEEWMQTDQAQDILARIASTVDNSPEALKQLVQDIFEAGETSALTFWGQEQNYDSMSVPLLAAELKRLKEELDKYDALKKEYQAAYDFLSISVLPERMEEEMIETLRVAGVGRLQARSDIRCAVPAQNREAVKEWLIDNGHGSMITETINASTLKAFVREMMKEGKEWPEDLLNVTPYTRATVVKA